MIVTNCHWLFYWIINIVCVQTCPHTRSKNNANEEPWRCVSFIFNFDLSNADLSIDWNFNRVKFKVEIDRNKVHVLQFFNLSMSGFKKKSFWKMNDCRFLFCVCVPLLLWSCDLARFFVGHTAALCLQQLEMPAAILPTFRTHTN